MIWDSTRTGLPAVAQVTENSRTYEYDALGNSTRTIDALGHERKSQYDSLNRLIKQLEPHPTSTSNPSGTLGSIGVDGQGRTTSVTDPRNLSTTYTVDGLGNITAQVSPDTGTTTRSPAATTRRATSRAKPMPAASPPPTPGMHSTGSPRWSTARPARPARRSAPPGTALPMASDGCNQTGQVRIDLE